MESLADVRGKSQFCEKKANKLNNVATTEPLIGSMDFNFALHLFLVRREVTLQLHLGAETLLAEETAVRLGDAQVVHLHHKQQSSTAADRPQPCSGLQQHLLVNCILMSSALCIAVSRTLTWSCHSISDLKTDAHVVHLYNLHSLLCLMAK